MKWIKFWTRNFGLFRYYVYIDSNKLDFYKENFGMIFNYALTVPDGKLVAYYHDEKELKEVSNKLFEVSCKNFKTFQKYSTKIIGFMNEFIDYSKGIKLDENLFDDWYEKYLYWQIGIYYYFCLEPVLTDKFFETLERYLRKENKFDKFEEYSQIVMLPEKMNEVTKEKLDAYKVALEIKKEPLNKKEIIEKHYKKYLWIPCYDIHHEEYNLSFFEKRFSEIEGNLNDEINNINQEFEERKKKFSDFIGTIDDKELIELSKIMHLLVYYKDHRDDLRRKAGYFGKRFMQYLADKLGISLEEINYMTPVEVKHSLKGNSFSIDKIRKRIPSNYVFLSNKSGIELFEDDDVKNVVQKELHSNNQEEEELIKGISASQGITKGRVSIVRHTVNLTKINEGDIMVAVTTHPDYVSAMEKCSAIITDEGGMTSHAAIVAREMKKPCIVGTKNATKIFKDGDYVEVDANKGVVRKI